MKTCVDLHRHTRLRNKSEKSETGDERVIAVLFIQNRLLKVLVSESTWVD